MPRLGRAADVLRLNREQALALADRVGRKEVEALLQRATQDLARRLDVAVRAGAATPTSIAQMQATLTQLRAVMRDLAQRLGRTTTTTARKAAELGALGMYDYLQSANQELGSRARPLGLREASMLSRAVSGAEASVLRRLATREKEAEAAQESPDEDVTEAVPPQPMREGGVLSRYSMATIGEFEKVLQVGIATGKPWGDVRAELIERSPFLQGSPRYWAERIVRTETMGALNRSGWESIRAADDELGDVVKILSATFDDRTSWDSYQVHGQIRRPDEAFLWAGGYYQHPPNRPNDREVVVPHRIAWPIPDELRWRSDAEVAAAWRRERRRGAPPPRDLSTMTTVPLNRFGRESA
jgi:hypothetical protein